MKMDLVVAGLVFHNNKVLLIHHAKLDRWLPPGGHIDPNETPDQALQREFKEETNMDIDILNKSAIPLQKSIPLATPFHVEIHNVGDHDHCCLTYLCTTRNPEKLQINKESKNVGWFAQEDLHQDHIEEDIRNICVAGFNRMNK